MGRVDHIQEAGLESWCFQGLHWRRGWEDRYRFECPLERARVLLVVEAFYSAGNAAVTTKTDTALRVTRGSRLESILFLGAEKCHPQEISIDAVETQAGGTTVSITYNVKPWPHWGGLRTRPYLLKREIEDLQGQLLMEPVQASP